MNLIDFLDADFYELLLKKTIKKGQTILYAEQKNDYLYFLLAGTAEATILDEQGHVSTLYLYRKGDFFGEFEPFYTGSRPVEITAFTTCDVYLLHHSDFLRWLESNFTATKFFIGELSKKLILNATLIDQMTHLTIKERILNSVARHQADHTLEYLTKKQLLKEVNAPLRSLNRELNNLQNEQIIEYNQQKITVLNSQIIQAHLQEY